MARTTRDQVVVKPVSNIYTVLVIGATLVSIAALIMVFVKAKALFGDQGLFG